MSDDPVECQPENCDAARRYVCVVPTCSWPCGPCPSDVVDAIDGCLADAIQYGAVHGRTAAVNRLRHREPCPNLRAARSMRV